MQRVKVLIAAFLVLSFAITVRAQIQYKLVNAFPNLQTFNSPTEVQGITDGTNRILVLEKGGKLWIFDNSPTVTTARVFIDLSKTVSQDACEGGLLGCVVDPNFATNRYIYLSYTTGVSPQWYSHIVRYQVSTSANDTIIPSTAYEILHITQPSGRCNHKGGCIRFGPDGYLYASFGDGGSGGDPDKNGQNKRVLLAKILRLDVHSTQDTLHYAIPATNPFVGNDSGFRQEIYAWGLRNPWKYSFDPVTGRLWAGDVGQDLWEEVDIIENGKNYGWNVMEGFHCYNASTCDSTGMTSAILDYAHSTGNKCVVGGFVYRGSSMPELVGKYIYGDYVSGRIWALDYSNPEAPVNTQLIDAASPTVALTSFGVDPNGELLLTDYSATGHIDRLVHANASVAASATAPLTVRLLQSVFHSRLSQVNISVIGGSPASLSATIVDELGRTIATTDSWNDSDSLLSLVIDGSRTLTAGIYYVRVTDGVTVSTAKFVVE